MFGMQLANPALADLYAMGGPLNPGPAGRPGEQPGSINVTDASRYGTRPNLFGGGNMAGAGQMAPAAPQQPPLGVPVSPAVAGSPAAKAGAGGMFANNPGKHKMGWGDAVGILAQALLGYEAGRGVPGASEQLRTVQEAMQYRMKKRDTDQQTAQYVQALIARGMNPNDAVIMAADPAEMAKHIGTHYDAATVDEGSSRYLPNLNGTTNVFTAPKTFQHGPDVVQMPGAQTLAPDFSALSSPVGVPQPVGSPVSIPGLRSDAEQYAGSLGLTQGTPAYDRALQDYTLKDHGPTAFGFNQTLQGARLNNALTIAQGHDQTSRYRTDNPPPHAGRAAPMARPATPATVVGGIMAKQAAGQPLTPAEQATLVDYRTRHKPQSGAVQVSPNEPVATDAHGNKLVVRNGQWVPAK